MKKGLWIAIAACALVLGACNAPFDASGAGETAPADRSVAGTNGTIDVTTSGTTLTVSYKPGATLSSCKLYMSQGNGTGLVCASQEMTNSGGTYSKSVTNSTFVSGAVVYICVLKNSGGVETCVPQGTLATTTSWAKYTVGSSSSSGSGSTSSGSTTTTPAISGYTVAWADEFDGTALKTSNWVYDTGTGSSGWGNNELEYYTNRTNNVSVADGCLKITAVKESYNGSAWTSGRIKTLGKQSFTYGKIQARVKMPNGAGLWPAFWMLGTNIGTATWPNCGEIDIMEHVNSESKVYGTIHWDNGGYVSWGQNTLSNYWNNFSVDVTQWHVYEIVWTSSSIKWYVDGVQYMGADIGVNSTEEFQKPFFILFNLAVGGNWPGSPDSSTPTSSSMYVDYVRVYKAN